MGLRCFAGDVIATVLFFKYLKGFPWTSQHGIIAIPAFLLPKSFVDGRCGNYADCNCDDSGIHGAHVSALDIYVDDVAKKKGKKLGYITSSAIRSGIESGVLIYRII